MRRLAVALCLVLAACSRSPSSPSTPASPAPSPVALANFGGYWSGTLTYKACGGSHCSGTIDRTDPFSLRLRQSGSRVTGVFTTGWSAIDLSGDVMPDGSVTLAGSSSTGGTRGVAAVEQVSIPDLRLDPATGLKGAVSLRADTLVSGNPLLNYSHAGPIVSASHADLDAFLAELSGRWHGRYLVRQCSDTAGRANCQPYIPDQVEEFDLQLTVAGDAVTGLIGQIRANLPVSGQVRGRTIELADARDSSPGLSDRVASFSATVDSFGRLVGRYTHVHVFNGITSTAEVEIREVVRVP